MKKDRLCFLLTVLLIGLFICTGNIYAYRSAGSVYLLKDDVLSNTGGSCSGLNYYLEFTLGQPSQIGESTGSIFYNDAGFWYPDGEDCFYHSGDYNQPDWSINLSELLRVIQYYNVGSFHCDVLGEDRYNPGPGDQNCSPHDSDYTPQDWSIGLSELLRIIQFYNVGCYECDPTGEDGYKAGCEIQVTAMGTNSIVDGLEAVHSVDGCEAVSDMIITTQITYDGTLSALGYVAELPDDWDNCSFVTASGPDMPSNVSTKPNGIIEAFWLTPPVSPVEFEVTVNCTDVSGMVSEGLSAHVAYRREGGELVEPVQPNPLTCIEVCQGDFSKDGDVDGSDLVALADDLTRLALSQFALEFGETDCPQSP